MVAGMFGQRVVAFLYLIEHMPDWAISNYVTKFPVNFSALICGVRGWKINEQLRESLKEEKIPENRRSETRTLCYCGGISFSTQAAQSKSYRSF